MSSRLELWSINIHAIVYVTRVFGNGDLVRRGPGWNGPRMLQANFKLEKALASAAAASDTIRAPTSRVL
jgi:hypothetical protein